MGQIESRTATADEAAAAAAAAATWKPQSRGVQSLSSTSGEENNPSKPSLDSLIAEAAAFGEEDENESLEAKAQKALECPCIAHLRNGPCGSQFSDAFLCFLKSTSEEKGSECVNPFVALQDCIKKIPNAFAKDVLDKEEEVKEEEKPAEEYKIQPPLWSIDSIKPIKSKA